MQTNTVQYSSFLLLILLQFLNLFAWNINFCALSRDEQEKLQEKYNEEQTEYENKHLGNFRRIYPDPIKGMDYYKKFYCSTPSVYQENELYRIRVERSRFVR